MFYGIKARTVVILSSAMTAIFLIGLLNLLRIRSDESITGQVIVESTADSVSLIFIFVAIAFVAGGVMFLTLYNRYSKRY